MPSSWSPSLRFELQFTGENINLWGDKLNAVLAHADYAIAGWLTKPLTGNTALSTSNAGDDEARAAMIKFTGAGPFTVTIPAVSKAYTVWNACTAAVTLTTGAGTSASVVAGEVVQLVCDGSAIRRVQSNDYSATRILNVADPLSAQDAATKSYVDGTAFSMAAGSLPAQTGNAGRYLTTNGTTASWSDVAAAGSTWALAGDLTPPQITADQNDYNPTGLSASAVLRLSTDVGRSLTGLQGGTDGRIVVLMNVGPSNLVLRNENIASSAVNRFSFQGPGGINVTDRTIASGRSAFLLYDGALSRWRDIAPYQAAGSSSICLGSDSEMFVTPAALISAGAVQALVDSATITPDFATAFNFKVTINGNRTLANPANLKVGQTGVIAVTQDAVGSRTLAFGSSWKREGGPPTLTTNSGATDYIVYFVMSTTLILYNFIRNPS